MIVRAIDADNDWQFGKGRNDYQVNIHAVAQNIKTRLQSFLGDCFFAIDEGIDWFNLLGSKNQIALELAVRAVIINTLNVTELISSQVAVDPFTRRITMIYSVNTVYSVSAVDTGLIFGQTSFLLTESGDVITTEDGSPLVAG